MNTRSGQKSLPQREFKLPVRFLQSLGIAGPCHIVLEFAIGLFHSLYELIVHPGLGEVLGYPPAVHGFDDGFEVGPLRWRLVARPRCNGKLIYDEVGARIAAKRVWETGRGSMRVYHCPLCSGHHLTHTELREGPEPTG